MALGLAEEVKGSAWESELRKIAKTVSDFDHESALKRIVGPPARIARID
ncbi:MAG: hypothetical protein JOY60_02335 [Burkholderiaceae bacterium]|nr:hypothetical protein [Burkholderiaceae bacterium]